MSEHYEIGMDMAVTGGDVQIEVWFTECARCPEQIFVNLPEGSTKVNFQAEIERCGWGINPPLCPGCKNK